MRYLFEAGVRTSINEFLTKEFANLVVRAPEFKKAMKLYLDPILIGSLGVSAETLLTASEEELSTFYEQKYALSMQQLQGLEKEVSGAGIADLATYDQLDSWANVSTDHLFQNSYDVEELEQELAGISSAVSFPDDLDYVLSESDFSEIDTYYGDNDVSVSSAGTGDVFDSAVTVDSEAVSVTGMQSSVSGVSADTSPISTSSFSSIISPSVDGVGGVTANTSAMR